MINLNILLIFIILCSTVGVQYKTSDVRLVPYLGGMCSVPPNIFAAKWTTVVPRSASLATVTQCVSFCHGECFTFFNALLLVLSELVCSLCQTSDSGHRLSTGHGQNRLTGVAATNKNGG